MTPQEKELLLSYLSPTQQPFRYQGTERYSTLIAGLRDCRQISGRDLESGASSVHGSGTVWLAAIGYFSVLDQIGSCFQFVDTSRRTTNRKNNSIIYAIQNFSDLSAFGVSDVDEQRAAHALCSLRNSFTHDFNLLNIPQNANNRRLDQHKFTVFSDRTESRIIQLPDIMWDGNIDGKNFNATDDSTFINLYQFNELVEEVYTTVVQGVKNDSIEIICSEHTMLNKYTFVTSSHAMRE